jgi:hypothetical protein
MSPVCHRCGTTLNSSELFCPHCGAPQLRYEASDDQGPSFAGSRQSAGSRGLDAVSWREAVIAALLVSVPVGLLSSFLDFGSLWVIAGGIATVSLYRRRAGIPPTSRMGWRIGALLGVMAAFATTAIDGFTLLFQRYVLHNGGELDVRFHLLAQQLTDQLNHSDPQAATLMPWFIKFWLSPDGTAAIVLMGAVASALSMLLFSCAGGAIGARITSMGNRAERSS